MGWRKILLGTSSILLLLIGIESARAIDIGSIGKTIEKAVQDAGHGIEKGTHDIGKGIENAGKPIETEHSPSDPCKTNDKLPQCGELKKGEQNR